MKSNEITWKTVPNNVKERMVDLSLAHKLTPCRKIRRTTKVMNTALKHYHILKTYSRFIKMKTYVLRHLSEDDDTDDNASFTDYNVLYKYDTPVSNRMTHVSTSNVDYPSESDLDVGKSDTPDTVIEETNTEQFKNTFSNIMNEELQENIEEHNVNLSYSPRENIHRTRLNELNEINNHESCLSNTDSPACEEDVILRNQETFTIEESTKSNEITCDAKEIQETENREESSEMSIKEELDTSININEELKIKDYYETLHDKQDLPDIKENLMSPLNQDIIQDVDFTNSKIELQHNDFAQSVEDLRVDEGSVDEPESSKFLQKQSLLNDNTHQPKDSGIDEDTEEEFPQNEQAICVIEKKQMQEEFSENKQAICVIEKKQMQEEFSENKQAICVIEKKQMQEEFPENKQAICVIEKKQMQEDCIKSVELTPPTLYSKDVSEDETNLTTDDTFIFNIDDSDEDINNEEEEQNKVVKQKLTPKVTHTEIVKNKYRIVSSNVSLFDINRGSKVTDNCVNNEKVIESVEIAHNAEDSMSPLSKRRLQQLRRLNLTVDSESSLSDDDDQYCNTENMRDKLFKRSKESSVSLDSEDDIMSFKHSTLLNDSMNSQGNKSCRFENSGKKKNNYLGETCITSTEDEETFNNNESDQIKKYNKYKKSSQNSLKQSIHCTDNENTSPNKNTKHKGSFQESQTIDKNLETETTLQSTIKNPTVQTKPCNLQELLEKESLIHELALPSVTLKDLQENDIYLLDIPSVVLESKLLGREFSLTNKKLTLGRHKYKITLDDTSHVSCVFNTGESCINYKAVSIKPVKKIVTRKRIRPK
ncbi:uncharacterized protein LOC116433464 [Nomia melanderi]|uniref:uncharacterized protein LOC116433464 n=1 Tax=Nomia melanderi TaxID=2448451 RepID=UPI003FCEC208